MTHLDLRDKFFRFWQEAPRSHVAIPGSSLVPENDPSVLFTTAGMHPLVPYLLGQPHPLGRRLASCQKCLRTDDIDEVGDTIHHTFFEMLGNWSLGDYFKKEAIIWSYEFLIEQLKLDPQRLYITCFAGDSDAPKDTESATIWESLGIPKERIYFYGKKDNWWGPAGQTGPCGPDTEMHYDVTQKPHGPDCKPGDNCGRFSEIWNDVFMQYNKTAEGKFEKLPQPNVDTGMGLERTLAVVDGFDDDYLTELWQPAINKISKLSGKKYSDHLKSFRVITDHIRAAVFAIADGVRPSNKERGYILRRLIRRSVLQARYLEIKNFEQAVDSVADVFVEIMSDPYPHLLESRPIIHQTLSEEVKRFLQTLDKGLKEFQKLDTVDGKVAFDLFQTFGFPWELTAEIAKEKGFQISIEDFKKEFQKHQELSRTASAGMFKGGLVDQSEQVVKYHTATHLLQAALRKILGSHVHQEGSNLTGERLRFDFSHGAKLSPDEIKQVEDLVNDYINKGLERNVETVTYEEAIRSGALAFFKERYPEKVTVYTFSRSDGMVVSREICGGPHVENTAIMGHFKITREEAVAAGIRRIYAVLG
ncbi:MAG: Alanine-tRNA ligase [Microgenomates group bacterium GW2011_GWA1_48_10]|uniref:Alanine--tRNA ligase n=1 Tax=Candidatus Gottesmanbacteria bacterium RIFCSPHIGHO2_01_FULL_47_48 TaxID=1798381 RepID=A0A1F6A662_9BACT|nr:MAG: Alanine-tRNA ligase [Microgenomates group bacterium GW2011_GWA1_48_10]OGG19777.1 MAG: alanine--tRNA ligase [Candidatus Gottesmanbacteria bacterium RIFCSPHIGHO2_01_FULL_47_48]